MKTSPWFFRFTVASVLWAVLLVWVGATVTTKGVGMAVPDWPLSFGSVNPEGWWLMPGVREEHGHRLLGTVMGMFVLGMVIWAFAGKHAPVIRKLTLVALVAVIVQGVLGGLRVTEISNGFAVFHGCFAQAFFCLLLLIAMLASRGWESLRSERIEERPLREMRFASTALTLVVFLQLILGATMRHTHRGGLADDGILTTGGTIFPGWGDFDLAILFSHKAWAIMVFFTALTVAWFAARHLRSNPGPRRHAGIVAGMVALQIAFGVSVIASAKNFWITNVHVLLGLAILAGAFTLSVRCFAARPAETTRDIAESNSRAELQNATT